LKIDQTTGSATPPRLPAEARRTPARPPSEVEGMQGQAPSNVRRFPEPADGTFDADKVAAIREQIRSGQYTINPERIADGLLAGLRGLLTDTTK
jgi:negative regulator of flagellin synthesis FlgM